MQKNIAAFRRLASYLLGVDAVLSTYNSEQASHHGQSALVPSLRSACSLGRCLCLLGIFACWQVLSSVVGPASSLFLRLLCMQLLRTKEGKKQAGKQDTTQKCN